MIISTSTNILCERADGFHISMADSIKACAQAGFSQLDFGFAELAFYSPEFRGKEWKREIAAYRDLANNLGITFVQGHGCIFDFCNSSDPIGLELLCRSIQGAKLLGIPWLVVHPSSHIEHGEMLPDTHAKNVEFFKKLSDNALSLGVGIAIENMWGTACPGVRRYALTAREVLRLVEDINRENVGVCWDVEHASVENLPQGDSIRLLGKHIKVTHISDETSPNNIHVLPYTGKVRWDEVLDAFADIDYAGTFSLEIQHYLLSMPRQLWPEAMRLSHSVGSYLVDRLKEKKAMRRGALTK